MKTNNQKSMQDIQGIIKEIEEIKQRNKKVEADKAWETSLFREILIAIMTYFVVVLFFFIARLSKPFINAIVPTMGFLLSTLSIPLFKKYWINNIYKK